MKKQVKYIIISAVSVAVVASSAAIYNISLATKSKHTASSPLESSDFSSSFYSSDDDSPVSSTVPSSSEDVSPSEPVQSTSSEQSSHTSVSVSSVELSSSQPSSSAPPVVPPTVDRQKLNLITPDGDDMAYHPKVVSLKKPINGYKYWIAFTPYPGADATKENPVINASNDLTGWCVPKGLKNPIDIPTDENGNPYNETQKNCKHYNSDTHLLFNEKGDRLELFWRYVDDVEGSVTIYRSVSSDGINWSKKEVFLFSEKRSRLDWLSPAIILDGDIYRIWYVNQNKEIYYTEIENGVQSNPRKISVVYPEALVSWHLDVIYNPKKHMYEMVVCAMKSWSLRTVMSLYYSCSPDNIEWSDAVTILRPSGDPKKFDSSGLYRSCLLWENGQYYMFYSGHSKDKSNVGVGLVYGSDITNLQPFPIT